MERQSRTVDVGDLNVRGTLGVFGMYRGDVTTRWTESSFTKAVLTPTGPGLVFIDWANRGAVRAEAWGDGAAWLLDALPRWLGAADSLDGFDPAVDERVARLWKNQGLTRMGSLGVIWQELLLVIIGQRVSSNEALKSWNRLCRTWGEPAPGPGELWMPPTAEVVGRLPYTDLHTINIERRRADAMTLAGRRANRLEEAAVMKPVDAVVRLSALPGLGTWTATATVGTTHGAPDTVLLGDYGMPTMVNFFFTGDSRRLPPEPDGDRIMLEHLAPWPGHRQRVVRLIMASPLKVPRRGPRARNPDIRRL